MLGADALVETPSGVSKCDFSDNFVFKNSAEIQNLTSWYSRGVNLVDCTFKNDKFDKKTSDVNFRGERFCSFKRLYLSGKLQIEKSAINKITEYCLLFFPQTWTQNHDFRIGTTVA